MINRAGVDAIPVVTSSDPPPIPAPPAGYPKRRQRGVVVIPQSDLERLVRLEPGQRIAGMRDEPTRMAVLFLVEGDGMPEVDEMCDAPTVDGNRWASPPPYPIDLAPGAAPPYVHGLVLMQLRGPRDYDPPAGTAWSALHEVVTRHYPLEMGGRYWCAWCCGSCQDGEHAHWPCADYVAAAGTVVNGLVIGDD